MGSEKKTEILTETWITHITFFKEAFSTSFLTKAAMDVKRVCLSLLQISKVYLKIEKPKKIISIQWSGRKARWWFLEILANGFADTPMKYIKWHRRKKSKYRNGWICLQLIGSGAGWLAGGFFRYLFAPFESVHV